MVRSLTMTAQLTLTIGTSFSLTRRSHGLVHDVCSCGSRGWSQRQQTISSVSVRAGRLLRRTRTTTRMNTGTGTRMGLMGTRATGTTTGITCTRSA